MGRTDQRDEGFTLIELLTTMTLLGIMVALSAGPWSQYRQGRAHVDTARDVESAMRFAQASAVAESVTYRVDVVAGGREARVLRLSSPAVLKRTVRVGESAVALADPVFTDRTGATTTSAHFYPRGSASAGTLTVRRDGRSKTYVVKVEGLTGRVSVL